MKQRPIFEKYETEVLTKYKTRKRIEESDKTVLDRFTLIGLIEHGFNFDKMYPTAKLSELGNNLL